VATNLLGSSNGHYSCSADETLRCGFGNSFAAAPAALASRLCPLNALAKQSVF
jgi:hypothetical protein